MRKQTFDKTKKILNIFIVIFFVISMTFAVVNAAPGPTNTNDKLKKLDFREPLNQVTLRKTQESVVKATWIVTDMVTEMETLIVTDMVTEMETLSITDMVTEMETLIVTEHGDRDGDFEHHRHGDRDDR